MPDSEDGESLHGRSVVPGELPERLLCGLRFVESGEGDENFFSVDESVAAAHTRTSRERGDRNI
jgi:hypothetical protein